MGVEKERECYVPLSMSSRTVSLAWTSITTSAPSVTRVCFGSFPLTSSTMSESLCEGVWCVMGEVVNC